MVKVSCRDSLRPSRGAGPRAAVLAGVAWIGSGVVACGDDGGATSGSFGGGETEVGPGTGSTGAPTSGGTTHASTAGDSSGTTSGVSTTGSEGGTDSEPTVTTDTETATSEPVAGCGDGQVEPPEACDDGNHEDGDGCESDCTPTPVGCGNGLVEPPEQCDDGNDIDGGPSDFCANDCTVFSCQAPPAYVTCDDDLDPANKADKAQAHRAIGICNDQLDNSVRITNFQFASPEDNAWTIARGFGTYTYDDDMDPDTPKTLLYKPREGSTFLMISTGLITAPNDQGIVLQGDNTQKSVGINGNPDDPNTLPAPLTEQKGSDDGKGGTPFIACDGVKDCSDTLRDQWAFGKKDPNDILFFSFNTTVPPGTFGYRFDFVYCSSEWPEWVDTDFNDMLIVWQTDPTPDDPDHKPPIDAYTGNVAFIPDPDDMTRALPLTVTALDPYLSGQGYSDDEPQLAGTGFVKSACSDWFTAKGGVQPGADLTIGFYIADMADKSWTTTALIDNFRWDCEGCIPSEVESCGVKPG